MAALACRQRIVVGMGVALNHVGFLCYLACRGKGPASGEEEGETVLKELFHWALGSAAEGGESAETRDETNEGPV